MRYEFPVLILKILLASGASEFQVFPVAEPGKCEVSLLRFAWDEVSLIAGPCTGEEGTDNEVRP